MGPPADLRPPVLILGGGFAGLSAATALAERGIPVRLVEKRGTLGGRAASFRDPVTGDTVDNGQHLFMGCYHETRRFLRRIGTEHLLRFQDRLHVDFVAPGGAEATLHAPSLPAPWHLLVAFLRLRTVSLRERLGLLRAGRAVSRLTDADEHHLDALTVEAWLRRLGQSERVRRRLWNLIAIATLNEEPAVASARMFAVVLRRAFFADAADATLAYSTVGLSDLYTHAARRFVEERGGQVVTGVTAARLLVEGGRIRGVALTDGRCEDAPIVLAAVPHTALTRILPPEVAADPFFAPMKALAASPILSINLWFDRPLTEKAFVGCLDTQVQWLFNKRVMLTNDDKGTRHVALVISGAHALIALPKEAIVALALRDVQRLWPAAREITVTHAVVVKEREATLSPATGTAALRPGTRTPIRGLYLAGDWTDTGLPATIESACVSGHRAAEMIAGGDPFAPEAHPPRAGKGLPPAAPLTVSPAPASETGAPARPQYSSARGRACVRQ